MKLLTPILLSLTALLVIILLLDKCRPSKPAEPNKVETIIKTLRDTITRDVVKWKQAKANTDSAIRFVYREIPAPCDTFIDTIIKVVEIERKAAELTHKADTALIVLQDSLNKDLKAKVIELHDSIRIAKRKGFFKGVKLTIEGFGAALVGYEFYKQVK